MSIELELPPMDDAALRPILSELVTHHRIFLEGERAISPPAPCVLRLTLGRATLRLAAEAVFARDSDPGHGVALQFAPLSAEAQRAIDAFLGAPVEFEPLLSADLSIGDFEQSDRPDANEAPESPAAAAASDDEHEASSTRAAQALHLRMRSLNGVEQRRYAATGNLGERVLLERLYGPSVWEPLIASLRLSLPEVATIARKGTVPRPLIELIASNGAWIASGEVQRALLANPRSSTSVIAKVLRLLPKHDLVRVPQQTAYPASVRQAAREMLSRR